MERFSKSSLGGFVGTIFNYIKRKRQFNDNGTSQLIKFFDNDFIKAVTEYRKGNKDYEDVEKIYDVINIITDYGKREICSSVIEKYNLPIPEYNSFGE